MDQDSAVFGAEQTHTYTVSPGPETAKDGEEQMSVKGTQQGLKRQQDNMVSVVAMASALMNFLCTKERGEEQGGWCSGDCMWTRSRRGGRCENWGGSWQDDADGKEKLLVKSLNTFSN